MKFKILDTVSGGENTSFWQSGLWKSLLLESHQAVEVFYYGNKNNRILVELRTIGLSQTGAFILGVDLSPITEISELIISLSTLLRTKGVIFLQIEPLKGTLSLGKKSTYRSFLTPHTRLINLKESIEAIFKSMHEKGRYNIRLAEKRGVMVEKVENTKENIHTWYKILSETTERDSFSQNSEHYYQIFIDTLGDSGGLYFAYFEGQIIAASIAVFTRERAIYYYGASRSDSSLRKHMAPYLLQWRMIQDAKAYGSKYYDFLGIANPEDPRDPLHGVSSFKEKFGGEICVLPEKRIFPLSWKYYIFILFYSIKHIIQR